MSEPNKAGGSIQSGVESPARRWRMSVSELLRRRRKTTPGQPPGDSDTALPGTDGRLTGHLALQHPESQLGSAWTLRVPPSQLDDVPPHPLADGHYHLQDGDYLRVATLHGTKDDGPLWEGTVHIASNPRSTESPSGAAGMDQLQAVHVGVSGHQWIRWFLAGAPAQVERAAHRQPRGQVR